MSYCLKNKLLNLFRRGLKFVRLASTSAVVVATSTSAPRRASSSAATSSSTPAVDDLQTLKTKVCIIGSGLAAHTAAIYASRAELKPILFEGWMANGVAPGGQLTTTSEVENFPGFPDGINGIELMDRCRKQSLRFGTQILTETVNKVDFSTTPFKVFTDSKAVIADSVIVATGAVSKQLDFPRLWRRAYEGFGTEAYRLVLCAMVLPPFSGTSPWQRDTFKASKIMQQRALTNPRIQVLWNSVVVGAYKDENTNNRVLGGLKVKNMVSGEVSDLKVSGLFFAIGHEPATKFLDGQLELHSDGYVVTKPGTTQTSVRGVFAVGDVQDKKYRQAVTATGTGCMAALEAEHYLQEIGSQEGKGD
uniref:FAD/NAD(P)-binding domain-containing protein n=1 Tax=Fagus sylvatica TaxID=28930 RepID=A0A2N9EHJ6_FAGSY